MNHSPLRRIAEAEVAQFEADGVVCLRGLIDQEWIQRMLVAVDRIKDQEHPMRTAIDVRSPQRHVDRGRFHISNNLWIRDADFADWVLNSPCPEIAGTLMRAESVRLYYDQVFIKEPETSEVTNWHHDLPFWQIQ